MFVDVSVVFRVVEVAATGATVVLVVVVSSLVSVAVAGFTR
jgi:hypothetical protein